MTWFFQEIIQAISSFQALLVFLIPVGYLIWKYQKRREEKFEEKFYEALCRRERIIRRIMES